MDTFVAGVESSSLEKFWRDFGINPSAMTRRTFIERAPNGGEPIRNGRQAHPLVAEAVRRQLGQAIAGADELEPFQDALKRTAAEFGIILNLERGAPLVNWDKHQPGQLDVYHLGGSSAYHEMVHVVQCLVGGACALGTAAAEQFSQTQGRQPASLSELKPYIQALTDEQRAAAMNAMVAPMEEQAYACYEQSAFEVTGLFGKRSKDRAGYREGLSQVLDSFTDGYLRARVPKLDTSLEAEFYGEFGHVARTHGETALLLGGAGFAYHQLSKAAMRVHPLMAIPVATPLVYVLYRALVTG